MAMVFQSRRVCVVAILGLSIAGDCCAEGLGRFVPNVSKLTSWMHKDEQDSPFAMKDSGMPAPEVTQRNYAQVQMAFGDSSAKDGNFEAARSAYQAAVRNDDSLARAHHRLALMNEKTGQEADSKELFLKAMKLDPQNSEIACDYGYWCYLRQDWQESQKQFQRALQLNPNSKRARNNLALLLARTDRPSDALAHFKLAGLSEAEARTNLGFVYLSEQRMPQAKNELQLAIAESPSSDKARDVLAKMESAEKSVERTNVQQPRPTPETITDITPVQATRLPAPQPSAPTTQNSVVPVVSRRLPPPQPIAPAPSAPMNRHFALEPAPVASAPAEPAAAPIQVANKPVKNLSIERPKFASDLPPQNRASARTFDPLRDPVPTPAPAVELTKFAARHIAQPIARPAVKPVVKPAAKPIVKSKETQTREVASSIRVLPLRR